MEADQDPRTAAVSAQLSTHKGVQSQVHRLFFFFKYFFPHIFLFFQLKDREWGIFCHLCACFDLLRKRFAHLWEAPQTPAALLHSVRSGAAQERSPIHLGSPPSPAGPGSTGVWQHNPADSFQRSSHANNWSPTVCEDVKAQFKKNNQLSLKYDTCHSVLFFSRHENIAENIKCFQSAYFHVFFAFFL